MKLYSLLYLEPMIINKTNGSYNIIIIKSYHIVMQFLPEKGLNSDIALIAILCQS